MNAISLQSEATRQVAREVATRSITLLENREALPLTGKPRVAVVGPTADDPLALLSGYSFPVHLIISDMVEKTSQVTTPLMALRLAVIVCHARRSPSLHGLSLSCRIKPTSRRFTLVCPPGWADNWPQSAHLLREEVHAWQRTPWSLVLEGC